MARSEGNPKEPEPKQLLLGSDGFESLKSFENLRQTPKNDTEPVHSNSRHVYPTQLQELARDPLQGPILLSLKPAKTIDSAIDRLPLTPDLSSAHQS